MVRRITGHPFRFGGVEHTGWLPAGAARPLPTPVRNVLLDLEIVPEADGYLLCWASHDGSIRGDHWFDRLEGALRQAEEDFGVGESLWQTTDN